MYTVKQLKELEEAAVKAEDYFQEQLCKLNQALQESAENSLLLEQQVYAFTVPNICGIQFFCWLWIFSCAEKFRESLVTVLLKLTLFAEC
jgi:uncharacterized membrane protein (DUF106 family)